MILQRLAQVQPEGVKEGAGDSEVGEEDLGNVGAEIGAALVGGKTVGRGLDFGMVTDERRGGILAVAAEINLGVAVGTAPRGPGAILAHAVVAAGNQADIAQLSAGDPRRPGR